jgi:hypothetical protein
MMGEKHLKEDIGGQEKRSAPEPHDTTDELSVRKTEQAQFEKQLAFINAKEFVDQESKVVVTYKMQCPAFSRRERLLSLTIRTRQELPRLLVIAKRGGLPFSKTDGEIFHRIEPFFPQPGQVVLRLPDTPLPPKTFGKLFFEDEAMYRAFLVHHPREHFMRLS